MVFFVDPPFKRAKEKPEPDPPPAPPPSEGPFDSATITKNRNSRVPYLEAREAVELEHKEWKAAKEKLGFEVREWCRPEIDEYIDCMVDRVFSVLVCKPKAIAMRRCMQKIETPEFVERRMTEILREREESGESLINNTGKGRDRKKRAEYNRCFAPEVDDPRDTFIRNSGVKGASTAGYDLGASGTQAPKPVQPGETL